MSKIMSDFTVSEAVPKDIPAIVSVHKKAFPGFLMTLLGPAFLKVYYRTVLDYSDGIFLVLRDEQGGLQGFVAGFAKPELFYQLLAKRRKWMMISAATHLIIRPHLWKRVLENMRMVSSRSNTGSSKDMDVELASIGVAPNNGRRGYGKALVRSFIDKAKAKAATSVFLSTDASNNSSVNEFYLSLGFRLLRRSERAGGRLMNHYEYILKKTTN